MPRMARLVVPGYPHHVTQRGNRRQRTFFSEADYRTYIELLSELKSKACVDIWAYCLMPNHVHLVAVPQHHQGLAKLFGVAHSRYARRINSMHGWQGHLWQERFHSFVMDEAHMLAVVRYIELNPVRAGLCARSEEWQWSSVHAHMCDRPEQLVSATSMREFVTDWRSYLAERDPVHTNELIRRHTNTGRPAGNEGFIDALEKLSGRRLRTRKPGPRRKS